MAVARTFLLLFVVHHLHCVYGHGMMMDPVNRSSAWRKGFSTPVNYNDNENFCGGNTVQNVENGGKCGICGDNYRQPRPRNNENTGLYGTGTIVKTYKSGSIIEVEVLLTTNHWGTFTFSLCPLTHSRELETEECFDKYPLKLTDGSNQYVLRTPESRSFKISLVLPQNLICQHCVLRWHYRAGNNWGMCPNGQETVGCGPQETFRSCADVAIV